MLAAYSRDCQEHTMKETAEDHSFKFSQDNNGIERNGTDASNRWRCHVSSDQHIPRFEKEAPKIMTWNAPSCGGPESGTSSVHDSYELLSHDIAMGG